MRYVSDDGIEFDTAQECIEYEENLKRIKDSFIIYDKNLNVIDVDDMNGYEYIAVLSNPKEVKDYLYHEVGWGDDIRDVGIYKLNEDGIFESVDELIEKYSKLVISLKTVKTGILQKQSDGV